MTVLAAVEPNNLSDVWVPIICLSTSTLNTVSTKVVLLTNTPVALYDLSANEIESRLKLLLKDSVNLKVLSPERKVAAGI